MTIHFFEANTKNKCLVKVSGALTNPPQNDGLKIFGKIERKPHFND